MDEEKQKLEERIENNIRCLWPSKKELKELIDEGWAQKKIAELTNLSICEVSQLMGNYSLRNYYHKKQKEYKQAEIKSLIDKGLTIEEIADNFKKTKHHISILVSNYNLKECYKQKQKECKKIQLQKLIEQNLDREQIAEELEVVPGYVNFLIKEYDLKNLWCEKKTSKIEDLAFECSSLQELGGKLGCTRERARQILNELDIHKRVLDYWRELRAEKKQKEECLSSINLMILYETAKREKNAAFQKAVAYKYFETKEKKKDYKCRLKLEQLEKLFEICYSENSISLKEISKKTGISEQRIGKIIRETDVPAPYSLRKRTVLTEEQKEQIERAKNTELNKQDIAYFLKLPHHAVNTRFKRKRTKSYKTPSQVYEAQDLGFTTKEIVELVERSEYRVKRLIKQRPEKEPKITEALSIIYNKKFEKPYL